MARKKAPKKRANKKAKATTRAKKPAASAKKKAAPRKTKAPLSPETRRSLLKARDGAADLGEALAITWRGERGLRVDDLSVAKLGSLVRRARKAETKLAALLDKHARQMQPVRDAHLSADDALWRALLDLRAAVGLRARKDPTIEERFSGLVDALRNEQATPAPTT